MGKINVKEWHEFLIGDFFDAFLSSDDIQPKNIVDGETPLVSSGKENYGIVAYIEDKNAKKLEIYYDGAKYKFVPILICLLSIAITLLNIN